MIFTDFSAHDIFQRATAVKASVEAVR